ncbi:MAG: LPS translocon maturation chaperone LptM [Leucothrix sp.]
MFRQGVAGNTFLLFIVAGLFAVVLLSGCGHRGDLYLPDTTETAKQKKKAS